MRSKERITEMYVFGRLSHCDAACIKRVGAAEPLYRAALKPLAAARARGTVALATFGILRRRFTMPKHRAVCALPAYDCQHHQHACAPKAAQSAYFYA
jgi:hypothetical protein